MISCTVRCIDPVGGEFAAGYEQPSTGLFVPLVTGCPNQAAALGEAQRLDKVAAARETGTFIDHNLRTPSAEWYREE